MNELLKKYIGNVDLTNYKYLRIDFSDENSGPGLADQTFQIKLYLKIAYELGLILILPKRNLEPRHNFGKTIPMKFSDYYDINCIKLDGNLIEVIEKSEHIDDNKILKVDRLVRSREALPDRITIRELVTYYKPLDNVNFSRCKQDIDLVENIIDDNNIEGCVHIRRGDRLTTGHPITNKYGKKLTGEAWDKATRAGQIICLLDSTNAPRIIYVMTDMASGDENIKELRECNRYKFVFLYDIPRLCEIKNDNNYRVFNIELLIRESPRHSYRKSSGDVVHFSFSRER